MASKTTARCESDRAACAGSVGAGGRLGGGWRFALTCLLAVVVSVMGLGPARPASAISQPADDAGGQIGLNAWGREDGASKVDRVMMVNHTAPLIQQAAGAVPPPSPIGTPSDATFGPIAFGTGYANGRLQGAGGRFPSGTTRVWAAWDYENLRPGQNWGRVWSVNGQVVLNQRYVSKWANDERGTLGWSYDNVDGAPLAEGIWQLTLHVDGKAVQTATFLLGAMAARFPAPVPPSADAFGPIRFGTQVTDGKLMGEASSVPSGAVRVIGHWDYDGSIRRGISWGRVWLHNGKVLIDKRDAELWDAEGPGTRWSVLANETGLADGVYQLELYLDGRVFQRATVRVGAGAMTSISPIDETGLAD